MPTSTRWEVTNLPKISVKPLHSAGPMRRPQASFEAQPRFARLLAPKMGIGPYKQVGSYGTNLPKVFRFSQLPAARPLRRSAPAPLPR